MINNFIYDDVSNAILNANTALNEITKSITRDVYKRQEEGAPHSAWLLIFPIRLNLEGAFFPSQTGIPVRHNTRN